MKQYTLHHVKNFFGMPIIFLSMINVLLSVGRRMETKDNFLSFILHGISDHYFLLFCFMPVFILTSLRNLRTDSPSLIVRFPTFSRYFAGKYIAIILYGILFTAIQVVLFAIVGVGLSLENTFAPPAGAPGELMRLFEGLFPSPLVAVLCTSLFMAIGLGYIGATISTIHHFFQRKAVIGVVLLSYVVMALSVKVTFLHWVPVIGLNRYMILHHNVAVAHGIPIVILEMIVLFLVQVILIKWFWYKDFTIRWSVPKGIFVYYNRALWTGRNIAILFIALSVLIVYKANWPGEESMQSFFIRFFYGIEIGNIHLFTFIEQLLYFGTPLYLFSIFLEQWCAPRSLHLTSRVKKRGTVLSSLLTIGFLFHIAYVVVSYLLLLIVGLFWNKTSGASFLANDFLTFGLLKIVEFCVLFLLLFLVYLRFKNVTMAFIIILLLHSLTLLPIGILSYNPVGFMTFARVGWLNDVPTFSPLEAALYLFTVMGVLLVCVQYVYKKYVD